MLRVAIPLALIAALAGSAPRAQSPTVRDDPATAQLIRLGLGGDAAQVGGAIERLVRSGDLDRAAEVLRSVPGRGFDSPQLQTLAAQIEPQTRLRLFRRPDNDDATRAALTLIRDSREAALNDPAAIRQAVADLTADEARRAAATRRLRGAGQFALPSLLTDGLAPGADLAAVVTLGQRIDPELLAAGLRQQLLYGEASTRLRAADAVLRIDRPSIAADAMLIIADDAFGDDLRSRAAEWFARRGLTRPDRSVAAAELRDRLDRAVRASKTARRAGYRQEAWVWTADGQLQLGQAYPLVLRYRDAVDAAAAVRLAGVRVAEMPQLVNATLAYEVINNPDWLPADGSAAAPMDLLDNETQRRTFEQAIQNGPDAAVLGWLRQLGGSPPPADWLRSGPAVSPIVALVDHPRPRIRYEAALWLAPAIDPAEAYAGQNRVLRRLSTMRTLPPRSQTLIIEADATRRLLWNRMLSAAGYAVDSYSSVTAAADAAIGEGIDLIVLSRRPADLPVLDAIDRLRRISTLREVPMILDAPSQRTVLAAEVAQRLALAEQKRAAQSDPINPDDMVFIDGLAADPTELNRLGLSQRDLLNSDLDADSTSRAISPIETLAIERWDAPGSMAGMVRTFTAPSAAAFADFRLSVQRRRQVPMLTSGERVRYRAAAEAALQTVLDARTER